jgi:hypothetical protein
MVHIGGFRSVQNLTFGRCRFNQIPYMTFGTCLSADWVPSTGDAAIGGYIGYFIFVDLATGFICVFYCSQSGFAGLSFSRRI